MLIYKICHRVEWDEAARNDVYAGSAKDREDHFIHFSAAEQVRGTLKRYFADAHDLVLVAVDAGTLGDALKFEAARDGAVFPHLYQTLPLASVKWVKPITRSPDGSFRLPDECA